MGAVFAQKHDLGPEFTVVDTQAGATVANQFNQQQEWDVEVGSVFRHCGSRTEKNNKGRAGAGVEDGPGLL